MENTYTYTARNAEHPEQIVTFTLHDGKLSAEIGAPLEQIERIAGRGGTDTDGEQRAPAAAWIKPVAIALIQSRMQPFQLAEVRAEAPNGGLAVTAWVRSGGLRVAPVIFMMRQVDNPGAAKSFVKKVNALKSDAPSPRRLPGLLDYWGGWALRY